MRDFREYKFDMDTLSRILFVFALCFFAFCYGFVAHRYRVFPYTFIKQAYEGMIAILSDNRGQSGHENDQTTMIPIYKEDSVYSGPTLITSTAENSLLSVKIIDMDGELIHEWSIDWFTIWPDATHIPKSDPLFPKSRPGTHIHGAVLLDNGDLVFNFEHLGLVRLDACGNTVWRLPYRTHHSIYQDEYGYLWVSGQKNHDDRLPDFPNYEPPFIEPTVLKISMEGKILEEISILDLLKENNLQGLLFMSATQNDDTKVSGDTLHLNDVETFPSFMEEGVFKAGDIMVSLRNINTILVFRETDHKVTYMSAGEFVRQHDPDFVDGNTISVFDNNNIAPKANGPQSRIVIKSVKDNQSYVYYTGDEKHPFFTAIMGKHQWLPNGNMLITESREGRAFEIDKKGNIVWEFFNLLGDGRIGMAEEAQRLSNEYTREFFDQKVKKCSNINRK